MFGTLFLVATPIGNLNDISARAIEVLKNVDLIAAEDTRHTGKLLKHFEIATKQISFHDHNEKGRTVELAEKLRQGKSIAVVSDAGTPGIADPGFTLVKKAIKTGVKIVSIPGAVAFVNALVISGLPTDSVYFGGFLPSRKSERRNALKSVAEIRATLCFYESPRRVTKSLRDCLSILGNRKAVVARELTKIYEEVLRGTISELLENLSTTPIKGEVVLIIDREKPDVEHADAGDLEKLILDRVGALIETGVERKKALKMVAKEFQINRSQVYRILQGEGDD